MEKYLTYRIEEKDEEKNKIPDSIFQWLSVITRIKLKKVYEGNSDIYYGNKPEGSRISIIFNQDNVIWNDLIHDKTGLTNTINFDIINAIASFMDDNVNAKSPESIYDTHSRLNFESSFQSRNDIAEFPIVNMYVKYFTDVICKYTGISPKKNFPENKKFAICLSHDVDKPLRFQFLREFRYNSKWSLKEKIYHTARFLHNRYEYLFSDEKKKLSDFDAIMKEENKYGFKSTFYFASSNGYSDWGSINDVFYNIEWDEFKPVFKSINENGFNIGLHASYNAYKSPENLRTEKEKLQKISNAKISGLRHHYWHLGINKNLTLQNHYKAGFKYDSSIAFNEHIGFRRNIALPYYPLYLDKNEIIYTLQIPVFCMDGNFFYKNTTVENAVETVKKYILEIKKYGGVGAIDWHSETSFPQKGKYEKWAEAYLKILEALAGDSEAWVTSPDEIYRHFTERAKQLEMS